MKEMVRQELIHYMKDIALNTPDEEDMVVQYMKVIGILANMSGGSIHVPQHGRFQSHGIAYRYQPLSFGQIICSRSLRTHARVMFWMSGQLRNRYIEKQQRHHIMNLCLKG